MQLSFFREFEMDEKVIELLKEVHKCYPNGYLSSCSSRSCLLSMVLNHLNHKSITERVEIKSNENTEIDNKNRKKLILHDGKKYYSHVYVELDNLILDSNLNEPMKKEDYENSLKELNKNYKLEFEKYDLQIPKKQLFELCNHYKLSSIFIEALKH